MRALKLIWTLVFALTLFIYVPAYYDSWKFNDLVQHETLRSKARLLKKTLLTEAQTYGVMLDDENIDIMANNSVVRVAVNYRIPINFYLFQRELAFRAVASGPALAD